MYSVYYMMYILLTNSCSPYTLPFCLYINNNRCPVPLWDYVDQKIYYLSNPEVRIPVDTPSSVLPYKVVPLPSLNSMSFPSIDNGEDWPVFATWFHANENGLLNTTDLEDTSACDGHPNTTNPSPTTALLAMVVLLENFPWCLAVHPRAWTLCMIHIWRYVRIPSQVHCPMVEVSFRLILMA